MLRPQIRVYRAQQLMKIVKRVSIYKGVERINQPNASSFKMDKWMYDRARPPFKFTTEQELYKYGYKNFPYSPKFIILAIAAAILGITFDALSKQLIADEVQTIYSYKLKEKHASTILLAFRRLYFWLFIDMTLAKIFPFHEYLLLKGTDDKLQEKIVRVQQYRYYQKNRDSKYDFMQLGVLQRFPYPLSEKPAMQE